MRKTGFSTVGSAAILLALASPAVAQDAEWLKLRAARQIHDVASLNVEIEYMAGELNVGSLEAGLLYDLQMRYDGNRFEPVREWELAEGRGRLYLSLAGDGDDVNVDFDDFKVMGGIREAGSLDIGLSTEIPADLKLEVGAAEVNMDLGGIPLTSLEIETGASSTDITFDSPNPVRMANLEMSAGAAEFKARGLGNARFDVLHFEGAVGEVTLDFTGEWDHDARAEIELGLGALEITFPEDLGVRLRKDTFLVDFDAPGFETVEDGILQSDNWDAADYHLEIEVDAAFGAVEINWE